MAEEDQIKECLECKIEIEGRIDKKFCSDYCRNTYNNRLNSDSTKYIRRVNNILRKNRRILSELNPTGKLKVDEMRLAEEGFNFHYFTNTYITKNGASYYFCYDQGYLKLENNQYMLVHKQDYVR